MTNEQAVLNIILNNPSLLQNVELSTACFLNEKNRVLYDTMRKLGDFDVATIYQESEDKEHFEFVHEQIVNEKTLDHHCQKVKEAFNNRQLEIMARNVISDAMTSSEKVAYINEVLSSVESGEKFESNRDTLKRVFSKMEDRVRSPDGIIGTRLGFAKLDTMLGGLDGGRMVIIGGRPKQGKSSFIGNIIENLSIKNDEPCVVYTLEMSKDVWMERFVFSTSKVKRPETGRSRWAFKYEEYSRMHKIAETVINAPIHIVEAAGMHLDDLCMSMQTFHNKYGVKNFFIDYVQLVRYGDNEYQTVTEVSKRMVQMKQKLQCNVFCVAQLSRASVGEKVRKPAMSDLRSSGQLEQDADAIIFVHRPKMYKQDGDDVIILDANRHGEPGDIRAKFNGFNYQWEEV